MLRLIILGIFPAIILSLTIGFVQPIRAEYSTVEADRKTIDYLSR